MLIVKTEKPSFNQDELYRKLSELPPSFTKADMCRKLSELPKYEDQHEPYASMAIAELIPFTLNGTDDDHGVLLHLVHYHKDYENGGRFADGSAGSHQTLYLRIEAAMNIASSIIEDVLKSETLDANRQLNSKSIPERRSDVAKELELIREMVNDVYPADKRRFPSAQIRDLISTDDWNGLPPVTNSKSNQRVEEVS